MLAWVMNLGFAASASGAPPPSKPWEQKLGLSLMKLGGMMSVFVIMVLIK